MNAKTKMKLLPKLSMKAVCGNVRAFMPDKSGESSGPLMRVVGTVGSVKSGESNFGEFLAFIGQFQAINLKNNEVFRSGKLFLPNVATDMLLGAVQSVDTSGVEFAFDIGILRDDESSVGYQYVVVPLLEVAESDPCARLLATLGGASALPDKSKETAPAMDAGKPADKPKHKK